MRGRFILAIPLVALMSAGGAHAGLIGNKVHGTIETGPDDADSAFANASNTWGTTTIRPGVEFRSFEDRTHESANFKDHRLVIKDKERARETSTGWEMTFTLDPKEFKRISLISSNFGKDFTYSLKADVLSIDWAGDATYAALTEKERRDLGPQKFKAIFKLTAADEAIAPVPEPGTTALLGAGLLAMFAFGWRRKSAS